MTNNLAIDGVRHAVTTAEVAAGSATVDLLVASVKAQVVQLTSALGEVKTPFTIARGTNAKQVVVVAEFDAGDVINVLVVEGP